MDASVFTQLEFWLLMVFSVVFPVGIYWILLSKRVVSKTTVLIFGLVLVGMAGLDVYLLQILAGLAKVSSSLTDDALFSSAVSVALYLLPAMFGGIGINLISHVLVSHLAQAEKDLKKKILRYSLASGLPTMRRASTNTFLNLPSVD